jgi:hypothetical protein
VCCGLTSPVPCPTLFEQTFDNERGRDDRHHTNDRTTPPTQRVPGNSGPPSDTAAPWLHPGGAPRSGARPAETTDHAHPAHAAGRSPTTRRAPDRRNTARTRHGHHRRASRRIAQSASHPTVEGVVLRHRLARSGTRALLLSPHRQRRPRPRPHAAAGRPPSSEGVDVDPRPQSETNRARPALLPSRGDAQH